MGLVRALESNAVCIRIGKRHANGPVDMSFIIKRTENIVLVLDFFPYKFHGSRENCHPKTLLHLCQINREYFNLANLITNLLIVYQLSPSSHSWLEIDEVGDFRLTWHNRRKHGQFF